MNLYCWIHGTYTTKEHLLSQWEEISAYPGVGYEKAGQTWTRVYHTYYQWIPPVLMLYTALFYVPRYVWKRWEGDRMKLLTEGLKTKVCNSIFCV